MTSALRVLLLQEEGALVRLIGTIERRGFRVIDVHTRPSAEASVWCIDVVVHGTRPVDVLCRQLQRLVDVRSASV